MRHKHDRRWPGAAVLTARTGSIRVWRWREPRVHHHGSTTPEYQFGQLPSPPVRAPCGWVCFRRSMRAARECPHRCATHSCHTVHHPLPHPVYARGCCHCYALREGRARCSRHMGTTCPRLRGCYAQRLTMCAGGVTCATAALWAPETLAVASARGDVIGTPTAAASGPVRCALREISQVDGAFEGGSCCDSGVCWRHLPLLALTFCPRARLERGAADVPSGR